MRRPFAPLRLLALAPLAFVACGKAALDDASTPDNVFGTDDRVDIRTNEYPFAAMGRLETGCSATLVGRRLVLTAAHCVITTGSGAVRQDLKYFQVGVVDGQARDKAFVEQIWFGTKVPDGQQGERGKDWAVLKLSKPLGDTYKYLDVATPNLSQLPYQTNLGGYSIDRSQGGTLSVHRNCSIREVKGDRLLHDCDAKSGISGGSMYVLQGDRAVVTAISVSEYRNGASSSIDAPAYSAEVANVAISAQAFEATVNALRQSVDGGGAAPSLPGVLSAANPNPPDPTDPIDPPPPPPTGDDVLATQLISQHDMQTHMGSLDRSAQLASDSAELAARTAQNFGMDQARRYATDAAAAATSLKRSLQQVQSGTGDTAVPGQIASALSALSRASRMLDGQMPGCSNQHYCPELRAYVGNVASATKSLRERLIHR